MSKAPNILLIDDNEPVRMLARALLQQEFPDAQFREVGSLSGLQQALEAGGFDIAITDYQLGWMDGLAVLRSVKSRYPDCPVVMFTGTGSEEIAVEAMKAGLDDYVLKSSSEHVIRLSASVRTVLAQSEARRTARDTEARYRSLINDVLDTSAVGLFILDAEFRVVWINEAMERYFGIRRSDVIGQDKRQLIRDRIKQLFDQPEEFAPRILQSYERNTDALCFECHMPGADGREERWLEHRSMPIRTGLYAGGRIEHYYDITERKRVEAALRKNEEQLAMVISSAMDAIIMVDREHRILLFNGAAEAMFGCAAVEAIGHPLDRFIPERFRAVHREHIKRYGETGHTNRSMGRLGTIYGLRADGTEFPLEVSLSQGTAGAHTFYTAILRDITERKRAEAALLRERLKLQSILESASDGIHVLDEAGNVVLANRVFCEMLGYSVEDALRLNVADWDAQWTKEELPVRIAEILKHRRTFETRHRRRDGTFLDVEVSATGLSVDGEKLIYAASRDITVRKALEWKAREANEQMAELIRSSPMAITVLGVEGNARVWNPAAERIFGWSSDEVLERPLPTVPEEKRDEHHQLRERVLRDEAFTGLEVVRRRKDGSPVTVSLSTAPLRNAEGRITGVMEVMADVTERKQMERYAGRIERLAALGQLLGGIAHEIKNPLFVLTGRLQLLKEKLAARDYGTLPSDLDKIEEAAKRMTHVTERFLTLTKPAQPRQTRCDIRAILDETLDFLSNELMKNQIRLVVESPTDLPAIWSDPRQLHEALLNLLLNAVQAMVAAHGRGTLKITATLVADAERAMSGGEGCGEGTTGGQGEGENWIEVRIQDDGPGIPPEHRPKLFEPFFSTKPANEGTGLGLWTVRTIVMSLKGRVTCETEAGRGTTFIVRLPVAEVGAQPSAIGGRPT